MGKVRFLKRSDLIFKQLRPTFYFVNNPFYVARQHRLQQVFGGKLSVHWLSPFSSTPVYRRRNEFVYNDV